jgi:hypothetical protein
VIRAALLGFVAAALLMVWLDQIVTAPVAVVYGQKLIAAQPRPPAISSAFSGHPSMPGE